MDSLQSEMRTEYRRRVFPGFPDNYPIDETVDSEIARTETGAIIEVLCRLRRLDELSAAIRTITEQTAITEDELRLIIEYVNKGYRLDLAVRSTDFIAASKVLKACKKQMKCKHMFSVPDTAGRMVCSKCGFVTPTPTNLSHFVEEI